MAPELVAAMTEVVAHRGPDAGGYYFGDGIGLGHRRLSIIDLAHGRSADRQRRRARSGSSSTARSTTSPRSGRELEARGHRFRTRTDTEVIVHGYEEWGADCVQRLRGMFAFAIWDAREQRCCSPATGSASSRSTTRRSTTASSSAPRSRRILAGSRRSRATGRPDGLDMYLTLRVHPRPGDHLQAHLQAAAGPSPDRRARSRPRAPVLGPASSPATGDPAREAEYLERARRAAARGRPAAPHQRRPTRRVPLRRHRLDDASSPYMVRNQRRAGAHDVGGLRRARRSTSWRTRKTVADHLGCETTRSMVKPHVDDLLPKLAWHFDEPFADSSTVPTYYVSAAAREQVTVALSGDGGDELWAGYAATTSSTAECARGAGSGLGSRAAGRRGTAAAVLGQGRQGARTCGSPAQAYAVTHAYDLRVRRRSTPLHPDFAAEVRDRDPTPSIAALRTLRVADRLTGPSMSMPRPTWLTTS